MHHQIKIIETSEINLVLSIDGKIASFKWNELSKRLAKANRKDRDNLEISPSGYGIHWPSLDEDLSIDGILGIKHGPQFRQGFA